MHLACRRQDAELVKIFVELGSPVDKTNIEGQTPLHIAAINGDQNVLRILLMARSDSSICDKLVIIFFQYAFEIDNEDKSISKIYILRMPFDFRIEHQSTLLRKEVIHWLLNFWLTNSRFDNQKIPGYMMHTFTYTKIINNFK